MSNDESESTVNGEGSGLRPVAYVPVTSTPYDEDTLNDLQLLPLPHSAIVLLKGIPQMLAVSQ